MAQNIRNRIFSLFQLWLRHVRSSRTHHPLSSLSLRSATYIPRCCHGILRQPRCGPCSNAARLRSSSSHDVKVSLLVLSLSLRQIRPCRPAPPSSRPAAASIHAHAICDGDLWARGWSSTGSEWLQAVVAVLNDSCGEAPSPSSKSALPNLSHFLSTLSQFVAYFPVLIVGCSVLLYSHF
jgi:hypothetical protein